MESTRLSLLLRVKDPKDDAAWAEFRDVYLPLLQRYAAKRSRSLGLRLGPSEVEEAALDAFAKLWRRLPEFDLDHGIGRFRSYLYRVVSNLLVDRLRKATWDDESSVGVGGTFSMDDVPSGPVPEDWQREFDRAVLLGALRRVRERVRSRNPAQWDAFLACWLDGRPAKEVAEQLELSVDLVYQNVSRVVKAVRKELEAEKAEELFQ